MKTFLIFLTNQSKRKTSIDIKVTRKPKPTKNNARPYLNEIPTHFIHEIKTKGYDVIGVNLFLRTSKSDHLVSRCAKYNFQTLPKWSTG